MRWMPLVMVLAACVDPTPLEHVLAPPTFLPLPLVQSAAALSGDEAPCAEVVEGCPTEDPCEVRVDVTFGEQCPFPVGVATGTAVVRGLNEYGSLWGAGVDLSEVRVDGRVPLVREAEDMGVYGNQQDGWGVTIYDGVVTWVEETKPEPTGEGWWGVEVARSGSTAINGEIDFGGGDRFELYDITWEPTCVQNPVSGGATRFDRSVLLGQRKQYEVSFHADCDGRVDVDGRQMAIDLLR